MLRRALNQYDGAALIGSNVIGVGIFTTPGIGAALVPGDRGGGAALLPLATSWFARTIVGQQLTMVSDHGMIHDMETIAISEFKATCLGVLERVRKTGEAVLITRRGTPVAQIVPPPREQAKASAFGCMRGTAEQIGDIVAPLPLEDWEALR